MNGTEMIGVTVVNLNPQAVLSTLINQLLLSAMFCGLTWLFARGKSILPALVVPALTTAWGIGLLALTQDAALPGAYRAIHIALLMLPAVLTWITLFATRRRRKE